MKKIFCLLFVLYGLGAVAQESQIKFVADRLFTVDEISRLQMAYVERLPELKLSHEDLYRYETIIDDNIFYMNQFNKKRNRTKAQISSELDKIVIKQNKTLKKLLSAEQYEKHLEIYNTTILSAIKNRLDSL